MLVNDMLQDKHLVDGAVLRPVACLSRRPQVLSSSSSLTKQHTVVKQAQNLTFPRTLVKAELAS